MAMILFSLKILWAMPAVGLGICVVGIAERFWRSSQPAEIASVLAALTGWLLGPGIVAAGWASGSVGGATGALGLYLWVFLWSLVAVILIEQAKDVDWFDWFD